MESLQLFLSLIFLFSSVGGQQTPQEFRLPRSIVPTLYTLQMIPVLDEIPQYPRFTAAGQLCILVNCTEATRNITLHSLDIEIKTEYISVINSEFRALPIESFSTVKEYDFFNIHLSEDLIAGESYGIYFPYFTAIISDSRLDGMYLDSYLDPVNNETKYVATTLFAANAARRAFPCFDEPDMKAVFEVRIGRHEKYHSLSNADIISTVPLREVPLWSLDIYAPTPRMSSYLLCMIVSDLAYTEAPPIPPSTAVHRVYAPHYFITRGGGTYSANLSSTVLSSFESYYNMSFPLKKLDNVALPQFYFTAMENWGLMTYADRALLYFEGETPASQKYSLSLTVSHEVSHNFFGNAVTCKWWTWIWLNEGWATFVAHQGLNMTYPELRPWEMFVPQVYQLAMSVDESVVTHPIASEPLTAEAVGGIYDRIVYEKAASVIRMAENFLTESVLQEGVRRYLKRWEFGVTEQDNLFEFIQEVVDETQPSPLPMGSTVKSILDTWTLQSGYPLITIQRLNTSHVIFSQEQYVLNEVTLGNESWWVPIQFEVLSGPSQGRKSIWIRSDENNVTVSIGENELIFVNSESIGYFRVLYNDTKMLHKFQQILESDHEQFTAIMRAKLLDDTFSLAFAGKIPIESALSMTKYMNKEVDFIVWKTVSMHLTKLSNALAGSISGDLFRDYFLNKMKHVKNSAPTFSSDLNVQLLHEELQDLQYKLSPQNGRMQEEEIHKEVQEYLTPTTYLISYSEEDVIDLEIKLGQDTLTRQTTLQILNELLETTCVGKAKDTSILVELMQAVCQYGNSLEDLALIKQINTESLTHVEKRVIKICGESVKEKIELRERFMQLVKSWVIMR